MTRRSRTTSTTAIPASPGRSLICAGIAGLGLALTGSPASAQDFPNRPVRMVVPFGAGGVSDIIGRTLASRMQEGLGQPVIVDNRGGAGGSIGSDIVARAQPDGHTILLGSNGTHAIVPYLYRNLKYDPLKDFTPIGMVAITPTVLAVNPELPVKSVKELLAYARAKPGALSFGSSGIGSTSHLAGEMLGALGGVTLTHVPYKSASAAYPDVFSGRVPMIFDSVLSMTAQGSEVTPGAPADLLAAVKTDLKRMGEIVKAAKIQPE